MKLVNSSVQLLEQGAGIEGIYKQIELAGRTAYKSESKITESSAKEFVDRMIKSKHNACLEHGTVYLMCPDGWRDYWANPYSRTTFKDGMLYVTTNLRVLVENQWLDDLQYLCEPTEYHAKRITCKFITSRDISHQIVRHRSMSFLQESQRFCNYTKDKFNDEITYVIPTHLSELSEGNYTYWNGDWVDMDKMKIQIPDDEEGAISIWLWDINNAAHTYALLCNKGWKPQQARSVLPNATKTELVMTGFEDDLGHFFELRCAPDAQPEVQKLATELKNLIYKEDGPEQKD